MNRKYANPPIIEAVCEFRVTQDTSWDMTVPGLLYEKLRDEFPRREDRLVQEWDMASRSARRRRPVLRSQRILFLTEERNMFVQLGPRLLAVHVLEPYPTWSAFQSKIVKAWESLTHIVEIKGLERIGLRYVNKIELPRFEDNLEDYFDFYPFVGDRLPQNLAGFLLVAEYRCAEGRDHCTVGLSNTDKNGKRFFLDLDYFMVQTKDIPISGALD